MGGSQFKLDRMCRHEGGPGVEKLQDLCMDARACSRHDPSQACEAASTQARISGVDKRNQRVAVHITSCTKLTRPANLSLAKVTRQAQAGQPPHSQKQRVSPASGTVCTVCAGAGVETGRDATGGGSRLA